MRESGDAMWSTGVSLESIGIAAAQRWRAGSPMPFAAAAVDLLAPTRVLEVGSEDGTRVWELLDGPDASRTTFVGLDAASDRRAAAVARLGSLPGAAAVSLHHATLRATSSRAPHFTRIPALVAALCAESFDLVVAHPGEIASTPYLDLAQLLPLVRTDGCLVIPGADATAGVTDAVGRLLREGAGRGVLATAGAGGPSAALVRPRLPRWNHEEMDAFRDEVLASEPPLATALAVGDHELVVTMLRSWLAPRLAWSTQDLLLPLGAFPPPLSVRDVLVHCARDEGGVWAAGAAVTLAMLYRAFGYPATVYQFGLPGVFAHAATLVALPDGTLRLQDAFLNAAPSGAAGPLTWSEAMRHVVEGREAEVELVSSGAAVARRHVYSVGRLALAVAQGYLSAAERIALDAVGECCAPVFGEPRATLVQSITTSVDAYARIPVVAAALAEARRRCGTTSFAGLLRHAFGTLPLTGHARTDAELARVIETLGTRHA